MLPFLTALGTEGYWWNGWRDFAARMNGNVPIGRSMRWRRIFTIMEPRSLNFGFTSIKTNNCSAFRRVRRIPKNNGSCTRRTGETARSGSLMRKRWRKCFYVLTPSLLRGRLLRVIVRGMQGSRHWM